MQTVRVFSEIDTPRFRYVLDVLFMHWADVQWEFVATKAQADLIYGVEFSDRETAVCVQIQSEFWDDGFIFEPPCTLDPEFMLFPTKKGYKMDVFSAVFWWISRMEEYNVHAEKDVHGRFPFTSSFCSKLGLIPKAWIENWLAPFYPLLGIHTTKFKPEVSIGWDLDNAYVLKGKPIFRQVALMLKMLWSGNGKPAMQYFLQGKDPHQVYDRLQHLSERYAIPMQFFIPLSIRSPFDRNLKDTSPQWKKLIRKVGAWAETGVHLGYLGHAVSGEHHREVQAFCRLTDELGVERGKTKNRFHYLKFNVKEDWPKLARLGIEEDYSLGFADAFGYRAGVSWPFPAFDLEANRVLPLTIFPIVAMDELLRSKNKGTPELWAKFDVHFAHLSHENSHIRWVMHPDILGDVFQWKGLAHVGDQLLIRICGGNNKDFGHRPNQ